LKYGALKEDEAERLKALEEENSRLKRIVADLTLDISMLKDLQSVGCCSTGLVPCGNGTQLPLNMRLKLPDLVGRVSWYRCRLFGRASQPRAAVEANPGGLRRTRRVESDAS